MNKVKTVPSTLKKINKTDVIDIVKEHEPITKQGITQVSGLSLVTVNKIVEGLLLEGVLAYAGINESTGGRPSQMFKVNKEKSYFVALYYFKNSYIGALSNYVGDIIFSDTYIVDTSSYDKSITDTINVIEDLIDRANGVRIKAIGIGVPGVVSDGIVSMIPTIASWENINIKEVLEREFDIPVFIENDVNLSTLGVYQTKYKEKVSNLAYIYIDQGVGASVIINDILIKGYSNFAGEIGNMIVNSITGPVPFETLINRVNERFNNKEIDDIELKETIINSLSEVMASFICIINPEVLIVQHNMITQDDLEILSTKLSDQLGKINIPEIESYKDKEKISIKGVIDMCISEASNTITLSKGRWK